MPNFDEIVNSLKSNVEDLVTSTLSNFKKEALGDVNAFLDDSKDDLVRWTNLLGEGKLSPKDFAWLMKGRMDLAEMALLKQKGLAMIRLDTFKRSLLDTVVNSVTKLVGL